MQRGLKTGFSLYQVSTAMGPTALSLSTVLRNKVQQYMRVLVEHLPMGRLYAPTALLLRPPYGSPYGPPGRTRLRSSIRLRRFVEVAASPAPLEEGTFRFVDGPRRRGAVKEAEQVEREGARRFALVVLVGWVRGTLVGSGTSRLGARNIGRKWY